MSGQELAHELFGLALGGRLHPGDEFLVSDRARCITGIALPVDAGFSLL